jgi:O-antigen ligase
VGTLSVLFLPHARAAAAALAVGLVTVVVLAAPGRRRAILAALVVLAGAALLAPSVRSRLLSFATERPDGSRTALLRSGLRAVAEHPWTGVGLGRFHPESFADADAPEEVRVNRGKSHDQWLTFAAEAGVPAALLFLLLLVTAALAPSSDPVAAVARRSSLALFVALTLVHDPLFQSVVSMATVLAIGLGLDLHRGLWRSGAPGEAPPGA